MASAAMLLAVAPAAATTDSAPPIGGYSGAGKPVPPGDDEIPYEVRFLTGSTEIGDVQVKRVVGARRSGRLLVQVPVRYPELRDRATLLLSDDATYRGRVAVRLRGGPAGRGMKLSDDTALPLGAGAETARFVHNIVVSRSAGRRMLAGTSMGEPLGDTDRPRLVARMHAVARFDQFGTGRAEEDSADRESRAIRVSETRPGASHGTNWQCAGDADLHGRPGPAETLTHRTYSGTVFPHIGQSQSIRLCLASDLRLDLDDWYWLGPGHVGEPLPQKTPRGTVSAPRIENGYATVTWTPDPGVNGGPNDRLFFGANRVGSDGTGEAHDHFDITVVPRAFEMRALGDSITAGWGYLGDGSAAQLSGNENDFDLGRMYACAPDNSFNNRCSSNSAAGPGDTSENGRFGSDTGLANNVAWPAQFANRHGIPFRSPDGQFATFGNYAVSGGRPEHWVQGGRFYGVLEERIVDSDPDLTVMTLGANPILSDFLTDRKLEERCGGGSAPKPEESIEKAAQCMREQTEKYNVHERLRAIFRRLLDAPDNHVMVAPYSIAYSALPFQLLTRSFVNNFPSYGIERSVQVLNGTIRQAIDDENARAQAAGLGTRIFMLSPSRFNVGLPSLDQVITGGQGQPCETFTGLGFGVDGPSNQSAATQAAREGKLCPSATNSGIYFGSLDGGLHLSRNGAREYANALDQRVSEIGLPVPSP